MGRRRQQQRRDGRGKQHFWLLRGNCFLCGLHGRLVLGATAELTATWQAQEVGETLRDRVHALETVYRPGRATAALQNHSRALHKEPGGVQIAVLGEQLEIANRQKQCRLRAAQLPTKTCMNRLPRTWHSTQHVKALANTTGCSTAIKHKTRTPCCLLDFGRRGWAAQMVSRSALGTHGAAPAPPLLQCLAGGSSSSGTPKWLPRSLSRSCRPHYLAATSLVPAATFWASFWLGSQLSGCVLKYGQSGTHASIATATPPP